MWLNMAEGDIIRYNEIKKMDTITEFWHFFDAWREKQKQAIEDYKHNKKK